MLYNHVDLRHKIEVAGADAEGQASAGSQEMEGLLEQFLSEISRHT